MKQPMVYTRLNDAGTGFERCLPIGDSENDGSG
jgi:hypothetical protein